MATARRGHDFQRDPARERPQKNVARIGTVRENYLELTGATAGRSSPADDRALYRVSSGSVEIEN